MRTQSEWQSEVDEAKAQAYEAGRAYLQAITDVEQIKAALDREQARQFEDFQPTSLGRSSGFSLFPQISSRIIELNQQLAEAERSLSAAEDAAVGAQSHLQDMAGRLHEELLK